jgi:hypothetical protein
MLVVEDGRAAHLSQRNSTVNRRFTGRADLESFRWSHNGARVPISGWAAAMMRCTAKSLVPRACLWYNAAGPL